MNLIEKQRAYFYDTIADSYDSIMNRYDLTRRLEIVFGRLLSNEGLKGSKVLDVGSGTGWFSSKAVEMGADVVAVDIGVNMLKKVREKCLAQVLAGDACSLPFRDNVFDVVISSECVEHTIDPVRAIRELCRALRPGGILIVTVPNRIWRFSLLIANVLKVRPYGGYENWLGWAQLRSELKRMNLSIISMFGFHMFPPIIRGTWGLLRLIDHLGGVLGPMMLNMAVKAQK